MGYADKLTNLATPLLVVGTGRCGTKSFARYLQELGYDVGHERDRKDGTVAWFRAFPAFVDPWDRPLQQYAFKTVLHLVREPLSVIGSWVYGKPTRRRHQSWAFVEKHLKLPMQWSPLKKGMTHWFRWNERCELLASQTLLVEDLPCEVLNTSKHRTLSLNDLFDEDENLAQDIARKARAYGYVLER